jgi:hypothetical protein
VARDSEAAIEEIRQFCLTHRIDADFRRGGWLWTATTRAQLGAWDSLLRTCARAGVEPFHPISPADVARRSGSAVHRAGIFEGRPRSPAG